MDVEVSVIPFLALLPGAVLAVIASQLWQRYYRLYAERHPEHARSELMPQHPGDWDNLYAGRPLSVIRAIPRWITGAGRAGSDHQIDPDLEDVRTAARRWGNAALVAWTLGIVGFGVLLSMRW